MCAPAVVLANNFGWPCKRQVVLPIFVSSKTSQNMLAAAPKPRNWTRSSDLVQNGAGASVVVVVVLEVVGGAGVDIQAMRPVVVRCGGVEEPVHPASNSVIATVATTPSLRTMQSYSTSAGCRDVGVITRSGRRPVTFITTETPVP